MTTDRGHPVTAPAADPAALSEEERAAGAMILARRHKCLDASGAGSGPCRTDRDRMALLAPWFEAILAARLAAVPDREAGLRALAEDAIEAIGIGGHTHWRVGGAGGTCEACGAVTNKRAELAARLSALAAPEARP